jgi:hypothetical protein
MTTKTKNILTGLILGLIAIAIYVAAVIQATSL